MSNAALSQDNYYSTDQDWEYMSVSQYKGFCQCEAKQLAVLNGLYAEDNKEAFLVGNYVHSAFESPEAHQKFLLENETELMTKKGTLRAPYVQAEKMVERLKQDEMFNFYYQGDKEVIVNGNLYGTDWKGKIDCLNVKDGYFVDIKTTRDVNLKVWSESRNIYVSFVEGYGYYEQMAVYSLLLEKQYGKSFTPYIFAVTKQTPPNIEAIFLGSDHLKIALNNIKENLPRILQVKFGEEYPRACGKCEYCRGSKQLTHFVNADELI